MDGRLNDMFHNFCNFFKVDKANFKKIKSTGFQEFMQCFQGKSFGSGLYRIHKLNNMESWTKRIEHAFPDFQDQIIVFAFDWMGRQFAIDKTNENCIILFDPGFGEVFEVPCSFVEFHENEIPLNSDACLLFSLFKEWREIDNTPLLYKECVGYKIPLFLNGNDELENLETIDMDVYWGIQSQLF